MTFSSRMYRDDTIKTDDEQCYLKYNKRKLCLNVKPNYANVT
jgi:hypothetical protein